MDRSEIDALKADLRRMQSRVEELETAGEEPTNRRNMLRGLGAAAAGAAVGGLAFARPAAATDTFGLVIGNATQTAQSNTALVASSYNNADNVGMFHLTDDASQSNIFTIGTILTIIANNNNGFTAGAAISATGQGLKISAPVPLKLNDGGAPVQNVGTRGMFRHQAGDLWFCVSSSGNNRWRRVSSNLGAGGFHAITPVRVYDSRATTPSNNTPLLTGQNRTVYVGDARDGSGVVTQTNAIPAFATAVAANVTVTGTTTSGAPGAGGFLVVNPGGITTTATSAINWFGAGQSLANANTFKVDAGRQLTVVCGGAAGAGTHFIIDVFGYYL
ncbi:hypothetical protein BH10ACT2_BH10ACT2_02230 [soil metagenome]